MRKTTLSVASILAVMAAQFSFGQASDSCKTDTPEKDKARTVIQQVIQASIDSRAHRGPNGEIVSFIDSPAITDEDIQKVRAFGDTAVCVLAEYVTDNPSIKYYGRRQWAALELLAWFKSDNALAVMVQFAEHSRPRFYAVKYMCGFPIEKTRPILKKFAKDPNPDVREAAKRCLKSNGKL